MMPRLLATIGLATLMTGLASAQEKAPAKDAPSIKAQVKEALSVADDDLPKAVSIVEKALKIAPDDREGLFLLGVLTTLRGEEVKDKPDRVALFHKANAAFTKLGSLYKPLARNEKGFTIRSQINEGRALSLEGKGKESFESIKRAMDQGFDDLDLLESDQDLEAARKYPEMKPLLEAAYKKLLEEAKVETVQEIAHARSFPFAFELKDVDDKTVSLDDFKGKVTLVDIWGTWCPPCRMEVPHLVEIRNQFKDRGVEIVGINCDEKGSRDTIKKTIRDFAKEFKINYPCLINDDSIEEKVPEFTGYPTMVFVDRAGKVRLVTSGYLPKFKLEAVVTTLLEEKAPALKKAQ